MDYVASSRLFMAQMYIENVLERKCFGITKYDNAVIITRPEKVLSIEVDRDNPPTLKVVGVMAEPTKDIVNVCTARGWKIEEVHL